MLHFYLRLTLIPITLFTALLILIHAQPHDDHELHELLLPEGCPAPCFMSIRPGITTMNEAMQILEASRWVEYLSNSELGIQWYWNGHQPQYIDTKYPAIIDLSFPIEAPSTQTVTQFAILTQLNFGEIFVLMHKPVAFMVTAAIPLPEDKGRKINVSVRYNDIFAIARVDCPTTINELIYQKAQITLYDSKAVQLYPEEQFWNFKSFKLALKDLLRCNI